MTVFRVMQFQAKIFSRWWCYAESPNESVMNTWSTSLKRECTEYHKVWYSGRSRQELLLIMFGCIMVNDSIPSNAVLSQNFQQMVLLCWIFKWKCDEVRFWCNIDHQIELLCYLIQFNTILNGGQWLIPEPLVIDI